MIIDADTHLTPTGEGIFIDDLIEMMEKSKVDKALAWLQPPYMREIDESNEYVYRAVKEYPDKILGFGWADPNLGVEKAKTMVQKCVYEYGFFGVKMNGAQNNFYVDDPIMSIPVIEEIAKTGKILAFHVGSDAFEETHPFRIAKIARMFPDTPILVAHMGGAAIPDLSNAMIEFAQECPNITCIGSAVSYKAIKKAINELGANRVCFGSDTPFRLMNVEVAAYNALLDEDYSQEEKNMIMGENILRLFGLE